MIYLCNLVTNTDFSEVEIEFLVPPKVGQLIGHDGAQWKVKFVHVDNALLYLRKIETGGLPK